MPGKNKQTPAVAQEFEIQSNLSFEEERIKK